MDACLSQSTHYNGAVSLETVDCCSDDRASELFLAAAQDTDDIARCKQPSVSDGPAWSEDLGLDFGFSDDAATEVRVSS